MSKKHDTNINIFDLQIKDMSLFKKLIGIVILFSIFDLMLYSIAYENFLFWISAVFFRLIIFIFFLGYIKKPYQYFKYVKFFLVLTVVPTITLSSYAYIHVFGLGWFFIIISVYIVLLGFIYQKIKKIPIDYTKTAKKLIEVSNEPLDLIGNKFHVSRLKEDKKLSKTESILASIPLWVIYAFPVILANSTLAYFSKNGFMVLITSIALILCFIFISIGLVSYQNIYIFHEAQKILDKKNEKGQRKK